MESIVHNGKLNSDEIALIRRYAEAGFYPVPMPPGGKGPNIPDWQFLRIRPGEVEKYWTDGQGVGLILGPSGLVCVDGDVPEAVRLAGVTLKGVLKADTLVGGREQNRRSHYLYSVENAGNVKPVKIRGPEGETIVELLAANKQVVVAPSAHPSGDTYNWESGDFEPERILEVDAAKLAQAVRLLGLAALITRYMPDSGRHDYALAIAGLLRRDERVPYDVVEAAFKLAWERGVSADAQAVGDALRALRDTEAKLNAGEQVTGGPTVDAVRDGLTKSLLKACGVSADYSGDERPAKAPKPGTALTDLGNAERLAQRIRGKAVYLYEAKGWYVFTGKIWQPDTTGEVYRSAAETVRGIYAEAEAEANEAERKATAKWAMVSEAKVRLDAMVKLAANVEGMTVSATIFDTNPYILACNNGTVDLRTGELRPSRAEDYVSKLAPVQYMGINAFAPRWQKFLKEIIPEREIRDYLQVAAGYGATGLSNARAFFICYGHGRNGKGTFLETVRDVLGDYGHTAKPETFLESRRDGSAASTDVASLRGTRLVVTSETKRGAKIDTNLVKSLTGDDTINARHLFERPMEFKPSWSVLMATNNKPEMPGDDIALWERVKLIPFTVRISDEQKDTALKVKLLAEGPGILAWIVRGAMSYLEHGLQDPATIREAITDYQTESDPVGDFITHYIQVDPGNDECYVTTGDLRKAWTAYIEENEVMGIKARQIGSRLKSEHGSKRIATKTMRVPGEHGAPRVWLGFALNSDGEALVPIGEQIERMRQML